MSYLDDIQVTGALYGRIVPSERTHGRIRTIDSTGAKTVDGFRGIVAHGDIADLPTYGPRVRDCPVLAGPSIRYAGEPIALVIAETQLAADLAKSKLVVHYERSNGEKESGVLHPHGSRYAVAQDVKLRPAWEENICHHAELVRGELDEIAGGAHLTLTGDYSSLGVAQLPVEPHGTAAWWASPKELVVWSNCQHPFGVREELARIFGLSLADVKVKVPRIGGGFGSKSWTNLEPLVAAAARQFRCPVKVMARSTDSLNLSRRHPAQISLQTHYSCQGRLLGVGANIRLDTGAYAGNGPRVLESCLSAAILPYDVPSYAVRGVLYYSRSEPSGSMRSIGAPQVHWPLEQQLDEAAERLGLGRWQIRALNLCGPTSEVILGRRPTRACTPQFRDAVDEAWAGAVERFADETSDSEALAESPGTSGRSEFGKNGPRRALGIALAMTPGGASPASNAIVRLAADGSVVVLAGSTEMGQGSNNSLANIVADELNIPRASIRVRGADTTYTPYDYSTGASRTTTVAGAAVRAAALDLIHQTRVLCSRMSQCEVDAVSFADGELQFPGGSIWPAQVVAEVFGPGGEIVGRGWSSRFGTSHSEDHPTVPYFWELSAAIVRVDVDGELGEATISELSIVGAPGKVVNSHDAVSRQEEGAALMGAGAALFERIDSSVDSNRSIRNLRVPKIGDLPRRYFSFAVEDASGPGAQGERGIGECAVTSTMSAVAAAYRNAIGAAIFSLPATRAEDPIGTRGEGIGAQEIADEYRDDG